MAKFIKGDRVSLRDDPKETGTVVATPERLTGYLVQVQFGYP